LTRLEHEGRRRPPPAGFPRAIGGIVCQQTINFGFSQQIFVKCRPVADFDLRKLTLAQQFFPV